MSDPAFPVITTDFRGRWDGDSVGYAHVESEGGMELRDYFAAKALAAILPDAGTVEARRGKCGVQACATDYAQIAYVLADAMIAAREVKA